MIRRNFLASLFAPLLGWLRPKPQIHIITRLAPHAAEPVHFHLVEAWVETAEGVYRALGDGPLEKTSYLRIPFVAIPPLKFPW